MRIPYEVLTHSATIRILRDLEYSVAGRVSQSTNHTTHRSKSNLQFESLSYD
jgi:hypothetical protein